LKTAFEGAAGEAGKPLHRPALRGPVRAGRKAQQWSMWIDSGRAKRRIRHREIVRPEEVLQLALGQLAPDHLLDGRVVAIREEHRRMVGAQASLTGSVSRKSRLCHTTLGTPGMSARRILLRIFPWRSSTTEGRTARSLRA